MAASIPFRDRLTCTIAEACAATGIGRSKLYEMIERGDIATLHEGRQHLVRVASLVARFDPPPEAAAPEGRR